MSDNQPLSLVEKLAVLRGRDLAEFRAIAELQRRISVESEKYLKSPVSEWPKIELHWDLSRESQRYSLDGNTKEEFDRRYPLGFCLGNVLLQDLDDRLCAFNHRTEAQLWEVGNPFSLAKLIIYLSEGRPISPPAVQVINRNEIFFLGGNHRYAVAKAIGETKLPIYVEPEHKEAIDSLLSINWEH